MFRPFQESCPDDRLIAGDAVLIILPIIDHPITINEWHAIVIGWVGALLGGLYVAGVMSLALAITLLLVLYAIIGAPALRSLCTHTPAYRYSIGLITIRHEPWYFLASFTLSFLMGVVGVGTALPALAALPFLLIVTSRPGPTSQTQTQTQTPPPSRTND